MKKRRLLLLAVLAMLVGCNSNSGASQTYSNINVDDYNIKETGALGSFDLISPGEHLILDSVTTFSWSASTNAKTYILEICSSDQFIRNVETVDYYVKDNITTTTFNINSDFAFRDVNYYWRVTAKNDGGTKLSNSVFSFFLKAPAVEEVYFDIGEADDWSLHPLGSYADISIDNNNFFGNDKESLVVSFKKEDTISSGWIIVTKSFEKSIYGTDGLFFNLYYAGQDSSIIIRLVDRDNEYWYTPVQVSNNAKQSVILKFSDFVQRTGDVTVANMHFDYERIKYFEIVFEKTFGDGVLLLSNPKAIKFDNYKNWFIEKLNFNDYTEDQYLNDNYDFEVTKTDDEITLQHYGTVDGKPKINGYGFVKIYVNRYLFGGDAIKVSIKYTGTKGTNVILRLYEEDTDRWSYSIPYSSLVVDEYKELVIPLSAFGKSSIMGDGKRQLYFIINIQFGMEGQYGTGQLSFKDLEIVNTADYRIEEYREVGADGLIEDFTGYEYAHDLFKIWEHSENNKDEYITLDKSTKVVGNGNTVCGRFYYKADMEAAMYYMPIKTDETFTSFSIWLADQSVKSGADSAISVTEYNPDMVIYIRLLTGEIYTYALNKLSPVWHEYNIPFSDFKLDSKPKTVDVAADIEGYNISHIGFTLQFFYKDKNGNAIPNYASDNTVLVDNIALSHYEALKIKEKERVVRQPDSEGIALIENFEDYENNKDMLDFWCVENGYDYQEISVSNNVSSKGGNNSLAMQHQVNGSESYYFFSPFVSEEVGSKVFKIDVASEIEATIHIDFYLTINKTQQKYRAILNSVNLEWTSYVISINNFRLENSSTKLSSGDLKNITRISIGITHSGLESVNKLVYIDNLEFDGSYAEYGVNTRTVID